LPPQILISPARTTSKRLCAGVDLVAGNDDLA
jgi:hypothetical protein